MSYALDPRHYAAIAPYLWPVLFLRLWAFSYWLRDLGREVLFTITPDARVLVHHIEDDPNALETWLWREAMRAKPHLDLCDNRDGHAGQTWFVRSKHLCNVLFGYRIIWRWVRLVLRGLPAVQDSS